MQAVALINNFRNNLRAIMEERKVTTRGLADVAGVNYVTISRILNERQNNLTMDLCEKIAAALDVPAEEMFVARKKSTSRA